jgi:large subunit ribosomal protein L10
MSTAAKEQVVETTTKHLGDVKGIYLADFTGMSVQAISELRKRCREERVQFLVIKNTLLKRALNARGISELDDFLAGPTGLATSCEDEVTPARVLAGFAKENDQRPRIKAAVLEGKLFDESQVQTLAALPSREVLLQQVLGTLIAPMTQFLGAMNATLRLPAVMADVLAREREKSGAA